MKHELEMPTVDEIVNLAKEHTPSALIRIVEGSFLNAMRDERFCQYYQKADISQKEIIQLFLWEELDHGFGTISLKEVESVGGHEGGGDHMHRVYEIMNGKESLGFVKIKGWYSSYDGSEWDEFSEWEDVVPYEVTVTKYKRK